MMNIPWIVVPPRYIISNTGTAVPERAQQSATSRANFTTRRSFVLALHAPRAVSVPVAFELLPFEGSTAHTGGVP